MSLLFFANDLKTLRCSFGAAPNKKRMSLKKIESIKGMNDLLPSQSPLWQFVESCVAEVAERYGYAEIRFPLLEQTELFKRSIGEVTDIVEKEMYTFEDRNGLSVSLRPEGTASCARACDQAGLLYNQTQKVWYGGPMFRYEKPQKGRMRQFHQIGFEAYGFNGPDVDAEMLILTDRLWEELGIADAVTLHINNLGDSESRAQFKEALVAYLTEHKDQLDEDSQRRLGTNPLRILDSKSESTQALLNNAPELTDFLSEESKAHFAKLLSLLDVAGLEYQVNTRLVRGLDYYSDTVFEWVTTQLGAQGTVCGGGRYDGLVEQLGGRPTPAVGCAMGIERLVLLVEALNVLPERDLNAPDIYLVAVGDVLAPAFRLAEQLRTSFPTLRLSTNLGGGSFKNQLKRADKSGAQWALILGEDEVAKEEIAIKPLRDNGEQQSVTWSELNSTLEPLLQELENF